MIYIAELFKWPNKREKKSTNQAQNSELPCKKTEAEVKQNQLIQNYAKEGYFSHSNKFWVVRWVPKRKNKNRRNMALSQATQKNGDSHGIANPNFTMTLGVEKGAYEIRGEISGTLKSEGVGKQ